MDEFDRQRLSDPALVVWFAEELALTDHLVDRRKKQARLTIYHLAMRMGYLDKKATEALTPLLDSITTDDLAEGLRGKIQRHVEACVQPLRDLEAGRKEWTLRDLVSYAHALERAVKIDLVPEEGEHSIPARHTKLAVRLGQRLFP